MIFGELEEKKKQQLMNVVWPRKEVLGAMVAGGALGAIHTITLTSDSVARASYRWKTAEPTDEERWLLEHVDEWVKDGLIEEARDVTHYTEASAPPKKDEKGEKTERRLCVNYRPLNKIVEKDTYQMPRADECLKLREEKYFTMIDLKSGFWQIPLLLRDRTNTAFRIGSNFYQWRVMPMGMTNSPRTFQRLIDDTIRGIKGVFCYG